MKQRTLLAALFLFAVLSASQLRSAPAPPTPRAAEQAKVAELYEKLRPEEEQALANLLSVAMVEEGCKPILGKYVPLEQLAEGCRGPGISFDLAADNNPARDPNYDYRLALRGDSYELAVTPRRSGLRGFFFDGKNIYTNPAGAASPRDQLLGSPKDVLRYLFASPPSAPAAEPKPAKTPAAQPAPPSAEPAKPAAAEPAKAPAAKKRKVWTEEDIGELRGPISVVGSESGEAPSEEAASSETYSERPALSSEEQRALDTVVAISIYSGLTCKVKLGRFCTLDELAEGIEAEPGRIEGFRPRFDPRRDPNYEYRLAPRGDRLEVEAIPRRPGLGGFLDDDRHGICYNPRGPATARDKRILGPFSPDFDMLR